MTDDEIKKMEHMIQRCCLLLGYAHAIIWDFKDQVSADTKQKIKWWEKPVENIVYLDKPLEPCPK